MKKFSSYVRYVIILGVLVTTAFWACSKNNEGNSYFGAIKEVDFATSMGKGSNEFQSVLANAEDVERYNLLQKMYDDNLPSKVKNADVAKIPKIIHQIWLGPSLPPPYFSTFQEKWKELHPDWKYCLWTDSDLSSLDVELRDLIEASPNYAEKSDILRCELLDKFGGVYLDCDMECHHVLDDLHHKYDFYAGAEYPHKIATTNNHLWVGISIMASRPGHPIMKRWREYIRKRWEMVNDKYSSGVERVINHTFFPFTFSVLEKCREQSLTNIVFPATYFYPITSANAAKRQKSIRGIREKFYDFLENINLKKKRLFAQACPESLAVHYWGNTWIGGPKDQVKELYIQVDFLKRELYRLQQKIQVIEKG